MNFLSSIFTLIGILDCFGIFISLLTVGVDLTIKSKRRVHVIFAYNFIFTLMGISNNFLPRDFRIQRLSSWDRRE